VKLLEARLYTVQQSRFSVKFFSWVIWLPPKKRHFYFPQFYIFITQKTKIYISTAMKISNLQTCTIKRVFSIPTNFTLKRKQGLGMCSVCVLLQWPYVMCALPFNLRLQVQSHTSSSLLCCMKFWFLPVHPLGCRLWVMKCEVNLSVRHAMILWNGSGRGGVNCKHS
jgi:hypothetical protein